MAQTPIVAAPYPDVPIAAGVPPVKRDPVIPDLEIVFKIRLLEADAATIFRTFLGPQWGIFTANGGPVAIPDSVLTVDFRREWRISDYPVEQGGFQSYDKVATPYDARVRLSCDGNTTPRSLFLSQIDAAAQSLDLFTVATPDAIYPNVNIVHYDYRRARDIGVGILQVDVWLEEVRATVQTQFTNTQAQTSQVDQNIGPVQAGAPTTAQAAVVKTPAQSPVTAKDNSAILQSASIPVSGLT